MASTSFGLMTMPLTPLVIAASMSAVCLGDDTWPSLSITVMSPSFSASAFIWFIMWTKNGKVSPGTDSMIFRGLSSACAACKAPNAMPTAPTSANACFIIFFSSSRKDCDASLTNAARQTTRLRLIFEIEQDADRRAPD